MPKKKEDKAWDEYLLSVKDKPGQKGKSFGQRIRQFLQKLGIAREKKTAVEKQVELSAKEGKALSEKPAAPKGTAPVAAKAPEEKSLSKPTASKKEKAAPKSVETKSFAESLYNQEKSKEKTQKSEETGIEKYMKKVDQKKQSQAKTKKMTEKKKQPVSGQPAEKSKAKAPQAGKGKATKPLPKAASKDRAKKPVISKKVALMPKAGQGQAQKSNAVGDIEKKVMEEIASKKPSLAKKSVQEIKKLSKSQVEKEAQEEIEAEDKEKRARGWYGDVLKHQRAALHGWHMRKRLKLYKLRKKKRKKKITTKEKRQMKKLLSEEKDIKLKISELEKKITALGKISSTRSKEAKALQKKVGAAGIKIPKVPLKKLKKSKEEFEKRSEFVELVKAMQNVADQMAIATAKKQLADTTWKDALTIEDEIKTQQQLIKNLELGFYKRRVDFNQFKEKMFELQSKMSELKIKKKLTDERMARLPPDIREEMEKAKRTGVAPSTSLTARATKALELMAKDSAPRQSKQEFEQKTVEALQKLTEKQAEKAVEKSHDKRFAQRTADALQKIAEKLGTSHRKHPEPEEHKQAKKKPAEKAPAPQADKIEKAPASGAGKGETTKEETRGLSPGPPKLSPKLVDQIKEKVSKKESEKSRGLAPSPAPNIDTAIKEKARGSSASPSEIADIEKKLTTLLKQYNIPEKAVASHIQSLDSNRLVNDFQKLISLIETKKENATAELIKPAPGFDINTGIIAKKKEKIVGTEREIRKAKIETSFDRVLNLVQVKGIISLNDAANQLGMGKKEVQECAEILERSRLIKLSYPPIGSVKLIYPAYLKWKENEKKRKAEAKKGMVNGKNG